MVVGEVVAEVEEEVVGDALDGMTIVLDLFCGGGLRISRISTRLGNRLRL